MMPFFTCNEVICSQMTSLTCYLGFHFFLKKSTNKAMNTKSSQDAYGMYKIRNVHDKQAIHEASLSDMEPEIVSSLFAVTKKDCDQRRVIILKGLNHYFKHALPLQNGRDTYAARTLRKTRLYVRNSSQGCLFHGYSLVTSPRNI